MKDQSAASPLRILILALALVPLTAWATYSPRGGGHGKAGADKVTVCHKGKKTLVIARPALQAHLGHGDTRGPC